MHRKITADSSANLYRKDFPNFTPVPLKIVTSEKEYTDDENLDVAAMQSELERYKGISSSSCPAVADWLSAFGSADEIFAVALTSRLSGCFNAAQIAAADYVQEHPGRRVFVLDSLSTGPELELLVEYLHTLLPTQRSFDEVCSALSIYSRHTHLAFSLASLSNFAKTGASVRSSQRPSDFWASAWSGVPAQRASWRRSTNAAGKRPPFKSCSTECWPGALQAEKSASAIPSTLKPQSFSQKEFWNAFQTATSKLVRTMDYAFSMQKKAASLSDLRTAHRRKTHESADRLPDQSGRYAARYLSARQLPATDGTDPEITQAATEIGGGSACKIANSIFAVLFCNFDCCGSV